MKTVTEILGIIAASIAILGTIIGSIWKISSIIFKKYQEIQELKAKRMDDSNKTIVDAVGELNKSFGGLKDEMIKNNHAISLELREIKVIQSEHSKKLEEHSKEIDRLREK